MRKYERHVFISYVREDQEAVDRLCDSLNKHGVHVWLDRNSIKPGARWKDSIREAVRNGDFFIACFSRQYTTRRKTYMNEEITLAIEELRQYPADRVWFIPVLLSECDVPARSIGGGETLLDIQWVPLYDDWDYGIQRILEVIKPADPEVQRLMQALQSLQPEVRCSAIEGLGEIRYTDAVSDLIGFLSARDVGVQRSAANALGRVGNSAAVPALIESLQSRDVMVRRSAAEALGRIADTSAVPALIEALGDDDVEVGRAAWKALGFGYKPTIQALEGIDDFDLIPHLITALKSKDVTIRQSVFKTLDEMPCDIVVTALIERLGSEHIGTRQAVAEALGWFADPSAVPALIKALGDDDEEVGRRAWSALAEMKRLTGVRTLDEIDNPALVPALIEALKNENAQIHQFVTDALGRYDNSAIAAALEEALEYMEILITPSLAYSLGLMNNSTRFNELVEDMVYHGLLVRQQTAEAPIKTDDPRLIRAVIEALEREYSNLGLSVGSALDIINDTNRVDIFIQALKRGEVLIRRPRV